MEPSSADASSYNHTHTYVHINAYTPIHTYQYILIQIHAYIYIYIHIHTHTHMCMHRYTHICSYIHKLTHTHQHTHTHTHAHTHRNRHGIHGTQLSTRNLMPILRHPHHVRHSLLFLSSSGTHTKEQQVPLLFWRRITVDAHNLRVCRLRRGVGGVRGKKRGWTCHRWRNASMFIWRDISTLMHSPWYPHWWYISTLMVLASGHCVGWMTHACLMMRHATRHVSLDVNASCACIHTRDMTHHVSRRCIAWHVTRDMSHDAFTWCECIHIMCIHIICIHIISRIHMMSLMSIHWHGMQMMC